MVRGFKSKTLRILGTVLLMGSSAGCELFSSSQLGSVHRNEPGAVKQGNKFGEQIPVVPTDYPSTLVAVSNLVRQQPIEKKVGTIGSSIMILSMGDFDRCPSMIDRAADQGIKQVSLVPTFRFTHSDKIVNGLCIPTDNQCLKPTKELLVEVEAGFLKCIVRAAEKKLDLAIVPHIDGDGPYESRLWRNQAVFHPLEKFDGFSYFDILINPIIKALDSLEGGFKQRIDFALQGEMGATVFHYPYGYLTIARHLHETLDEKAPELRVGISLNGNRIAGNDVGTLPSPGDYQREEVYLPNFQKNPAPGVAQKENTLALFSYIDFLGMSHYGKLIQPERPTVLDFDDYVHDFAVELKAFDVDLTQFFSPSNNKEFHLSEFGHGGTSPGEPYLGANPFSRQNPWESSQNRDVLCGYFEAAGLFLSGTAKSVRWGADKAFVWNLGSWDIQGIYEGDPLADQYKQPNIVTLIKQYHASPLSNTAQCRPGQSLENAAHSEPETRPVVDGYYVCKPPLDTATGSFGWLNRTVHLDMSLVKGQRSCRVQ